ncbi:17624_t:CDS:1 [Dentiscutata erythropus]|uniref:17624_t:CDS:1 n=1 Tax=Dentiscutata erythropus TaxID=1348616 RepID=A0A9N9JRZ7_9GLOM|nr:17624_t:CDS:1 [Dentiscutata erythropus]
MSTTTNIKNKRVRQHNRSLIYTERLQNPNESITPTVTPLVLTSSSSSYDPKEWMQYNKILQQNKKQQQANLEWATVYSIFKQFHSLSKHIESQNFEYDDAKNKELRILIKKSMSMEGVERAETARFRRVFDLVDYVRKTIENEQIDLETFLNNIKPLKLTLNYLKEVELVEFKNLVNLVLEKLKNQPN